MAIGQVGLAGALDVPGLAALEAELEWAGAARSAAHATVLSRALQLDDLLTSAGMGLGVSAHLALLLRGSGYQADRLLEQARVLDGLPDGFAVLADGVLTVEQLGVFVAEAEQLSPPLRRVLWDRTVALLRTALADGAALPPAELTRRLRRWAVQADPDGAVERRRAGEKDADVDYRRRQDGLVDLFAFGITGPNAQACLASIAARSAPIGPDDPRTAGQRRRDAVVDLLTGRDSLFTPTEGACAAAGPVEGPASTCSGRQRSCGCPLGAAVPCGAQVQLLVPLGAALGTTDEVAEVVGHGPLDPDLLRQALLARPRLHTVWVDEHGVPVAMADRAVRPRRGDEADLRRTLLLLAAQPPPPPEQLRARHPHDHAQAPAPDTGAVRGPISEPEDGGAAVAATGRHVDEAARTGPGPTCADPGRGGHPPGAPGAYRVPPRLRRFLLARAPVCEWPGCGARAVHCDLDHDVAWPAGPTCACNLGPACRRHHRIKQTGWTKTRTATAVLWSSPTGRTWTSPTPHQPAQAPVRPLPPLVPPHWSDELSDLQLEHELRALHPDDPALDDEPGDVCEAPEVLDVDRLGHRLTRADTRWTLDLDDPYRWLPQPT